MFGLFFHESRHFCRFVNVKYLMYVNLLWGMTKKIAFFLVLSHTYYYLCNVFERMQCFFIRLVV